MTAAGCDGSPRGLSAESAGGRARRARARARLSRRVRTGTRGLRRGDGGRGGRAPAPGGGRSGRIASAAGGDAAALRAVLGGGRGRRGRRRLELHRLRDGGGGPAGPAQRHHRLPPGPARVRGRPVPGEGRVGRAVGRRADTCCPEEEARVAAPRSRPARGSLSSPGRWRGQEATLRVSATPPAALPRSASGRARNGGALPEGPGSPSTCRAARAPGAGALSASPLTMAGHRLLGTSLPPGVYSVETVGWRK